MSRRIGIALAGLAVTATLVLGGLALPTEGAQAAAAKKRSFNACGQVQDEAAFWANEMKHAETYEEWKLYSDRLGEAQLGIAIFC